MAGPFYNAIKGTTAGAPGTGAFTPNAASSGFRAWSVVPTGWWGLVRYEDGSDWELTYSYWNGTTLSRASTQRVASSTGSPLSLTSAATAALVSDGARISPTLNTPVSIVRPIPGSTTIQLLGFPNGTTTGTASSVALNGSNILGGLPRILIASATTANAQAGYSHASIYGFTSTTAGLGGWQFMVRFGATTLPTGPRLFMGVASTNYAGVTTEPSARVAGYAVFGKDSTDATIQLMTNSNSGGATKIDTGITLATNDVYDGNIWTDPGSVLVHALLVRRDTGDIFYTETSTDVPTTGTGLMPMCFGGLNGTDTGTAFTLAFGGYAFRTGGW